MSEPPPEKERRTRLLYVSPLRALAVDVEKNLRAPLAGIRLAAERLGIEIHEPTVGMRTGDTSADERRRLVRHPADILITTPESLYLMLTSQARETLRNVEAVIVDEIHSVAATKRGAHLALTLERLDALCDRPPQRIGLSATQRPLDEIARFLGGPRRQRPAPAGHDRRRRRAQAARRRGDRPGRRHGRARRGHRRAGLGSGGRRAAAAQHLAVDAPAAARARRVAPVHADLRQRPPAGRAPGHAPQRAARPNATTAPTQHRRRAGRCAARRRRAGQGPPRLAVARATAAARRRAQVGSPARGSCARPRSSSASTWVRSISSCRSSRPARSRPACSASAAPATRSASRARGKLFPKHRADLVEASVVVQRMQDGLIEHTRYPRNPLDVLAQQIVAMCALDEWKVDELAALVRRAANFAELSDEVFTSVLDLLAGPLPERRVRRAAAAHRVGPRQRHRPRPRRRATARGHERRHDPRPRAVRRLPARRHPRRRARRRDGVRVACRRDVPARRVHVAHRGHHLRAGRSSRPRPGCRARCRSGTATVPAGRSSSAGRSARSCATSAAGALARPNGCTPTTGSTSCAAGNLVQYLDDQAEATGVVPDDRTIVVERFRDEIGDWRVCVLSPFGAQVHAPWAMALQARLAERWGIDVELHVERRRHRAAPARGGRRSAGRRAAHRPGRDRRPRDLAAAELGAVRVAVP